MKNKIEKFIEHLKIKNYSKKTIKGYGMELNKFFQELDCKDIRNITTRDIEKYLMKLRESGCAPETVNLAITRIRQFFRYMEKQSYILLNPAGNLEYIKQQKKLPLHVLSFREMIKLLE